MIHSRLQRMPYWQRLLQPQTATAQSSSKILHLSLVPQHKTKQAPDTAAAQCWWVLCSKYPQSRGKHQCASADLDCRARQPGKVHFGLQKLWQNLCSQLELYPAEAIKTAWILVLNFYREMRIFCVWLIPPFVSWVGAAWAGALWEKSSLGKCQLSRLACLWKFGFHFSQRGCCILTTWCLLEKPGRGTL